MPCLPLRPPSGRAAGSLTRVPQPGHVRRHLPRTQGTSAPAGAAVGRALPSVVRVGPDHTGHPRRWGHGAAGTTCGWGWGSAQHLLVSSGIQGSHWSCNPHPEPGQGVVRARGDVLCLFSFGLWGSSFPHLLRVGRAVCCSSRRPHLGLLVPVAMGTKEVSQGYKLRPVAPSVTHIACLSQSGLCGRACWV